MTETKQIVKAEQTDISVQEWGSRQDVQLLGQRLRAMLPNGNKLSIEQACGLGQAALSMGANPFSGEIYGFAGKGGFQLVQGYKLLIRWAKRQCEYETRYKLISDPQAPMITYTCTLLRADKRHLLREYIGMGAKFNEAFELVADTSTGTCAKTHTPPNGWTNEQVAQKRALKNVINLAYAQPSMKEIADESWMVEGVHTKPEDWEKISDASLGDPEAAQLEAKYNAERRVYRESGKHQTAEQAMSELFDDLGEDDDTMTLEAREGYQNGGADWLDTPSEPLEKPEWGKEPVTYNNDPVEVILPEQETELKTTARFDSRFPNNPCNDYPGMFEAAVKMFSYYENVEYVKAVLKEFHPTGTVPECWAFLAEHQKEAMTQ